MDSENAPLLLNHDELEVNVTHANPNAGRSQPQTQAQQHLCSRCACEVDSDSYKITPRHILIFAAIVWCLTIFSLLVGHMAVGERPKFTTVFVTIWTFVTLPILLVLLIMGHRRHSRHKLGRTVTQIRVLCALAVSWLLLVTGLITLNANPSSTCGWWNRGDCRKLLTAAHAFSWILIVTLFSAAYATYRRAVSLHGTAMVLPPPPPMVPAWRLSGVADNEGPMSEGNLKI
ncbi:hypothetical protein MVEN_00770300 [Mycena venus]|uniref:Uncharacterized protein n=1 Tax=Mycena venus TaxID=2733690 RepID=A0A8H6YK12_9AGAR|nr:hypothetical protein MVEN_00770300 [Mycena venus]